MSDSESKQENSNIRKPLYIRDKNNPNILHKYPYYEKPQTSTRLGFSDIIKRFQKPPQFTTKPPYPQDKKNSAKLSAYISVKSINISTIKKFY